MKRLIYLAPFVLFACAPISEKQCQAGNWYELGVADGTKGITADRVGKYHEECAQYGVSVSSTQWIKGREQGLKQYCTVANAEALGRKGRRLNDVCDNSDKLAPVYRHGLGYNRLVDKLDDLKDERKDLRRILSNNFEGEITEEQDRLRKRYLRRLHRLENDIDDLRRDMRRYPSYSS